MSQQISNLPIGAKVKDLNTKYYGEPIVFQIVDKNHAGYPANSVTLITERIITLKSFDAKEPDNSNNNNRRNYGNNRYLHSNIRQWLNKDSSPWYVAQHGADSPPNDSGVTYNPYETEGGFLSNFSADFKNRILTTTLTVAKVSADGGGSETVQDKVFLLSRTEVGLSNENNIAEGSRLALFSSSDSSRIAYPTAEAVNQSAYTANDLAPSRPWQWWLRTPNTEVSASDSVRRVTPSGSLISNISVSTAYAGHCGVRPALNLPSDIRVSDNPDSDGAYILFINTEISIPPDYIGQKTSADKSNILSYSITTNGTMSDITEKINGVTIATRTNPTSGQEFTVSLTQEQWDAIKYGNGHTLTIEMGSDTWTYTFDKRLNANDDILSAVKGVQDLQDHLNAIKAQLGSAITDVDPNVIVPTNPTFQQLATAIGQISTSKKWASGNVRTDESGKFTVTGLSFRPKLIVMHDPSASNRYSQIIITSTYSDLNAYGYIKEPYEYNAISLFISNDGFYQPNIGIKPNTLFNWYAFE